MERLKFEADRAEREGNYERVAEIRYGKLQALQAEIDKISGSLKQRQGNEALVKEEVTADDIADVVSRWTGIPRQSNAAKRARKACAPRNRTASARNRTR